jgi:hypothetical protein
MNFKELPEFNREVKKLSRKWRSIPDDLELVKRVIPLFYPLGDERDASRFRDAYFATRKATALKQGEMYEVVKMRLDCKSPGAGNKLRLVFTYVYVQDTVTFIELYAKNDKSREDKSRINEFIKTLGCA